MVDIRTAEHHGICPTCEGYGGNSEPGCVNGDCTGVCPACWCPGCHDGATGDSQSAVAFGVDPEEYAGSWPAYCAVQKATA